MSARIHWLSNVLRAAAVGAGLLAAAASSGSSQRQAPAAPQAQFASPAPRQMAPENAIGLWRSSFGPVKIEEDPGGGPQAVQGAWRYMRGGQEVVGLFWGTLRGNVLDFEWQEPGDDGSLRGQGYLVFDLTGDRFNGKWWTAGQERYGDWNGWRPEGQADRAAPDDGYGGDEYGGDEYGGGYDDGYGGGDYGPAEPPPPPPGY